MCLCCCSTRKSILAYIIVISIIAFIFGIVVILDFASDTSLYKILINKFKELEAENVNNNYYNSNYDFSRNDYYDPYSSYYNNYNYNYNYNNYNNYNNDVDIVQKVKDAAALLKIETLTYDDLQQHSYKFIKKLKGIEKGLGTLLFISPLIFLIVAIVFLVSMCGKRETQIVTTNTFNLCSIVKIIVVILGIIFVLLSLVYGILLLVVYLQYSKLINSNSDTCAIKIILGMIYGYFSCWFYSNITNALIKEASIFNNVGEENKIGPDAEYDLNGNPLGGRTIQISSNLNGVNPQNNAQNRNEPIYQQVQQIPVNTQNQGTMETQKQMQITTQNNINELNLNKQTEQNNVNIV